MNQEITKSNKNIKVKAYEGSSIVHSLKETEAYYYRSTAPDYHRSYILLVKQKIQNLFNFFRSYVY